VYILHVKLRKLSCYRQLTKTVPLACYCLIAYSLTILKIALDHGCISTVAICQVRLFAMMDLLNTNELLNVTIPFTN